MKKKLFGMLLAGALIASQCVTAFAAGSKDAGTEVPGLSGGAPEGYSISTDVSATISELRQNARRQQQQRSNRQIQDNWMQSQIR